MCGRFALGQQHIDFLEALDQQYPRIFRRQPGGRPPQRLRGGGPEEEEKLDIKPEESDVIPSQEAIQPDEGEVKAGEEEDKPKAEDLETSNAAGDESNAPNDQEAAEDAADAKPKPEADSRPGKAPMEDLKWHAAPTLGFSWKREQDFWPRLAFIFVHELSSATTLLRGSGHL